MILGLEGRGVQLAYIGSLAAVLLCVIYGIVNWNKPRQEDQAKEADEETKWEKEDNKIEG